METMMLSLKDLTLSPHQARTRHADRNVGELAASIERLGQLQPIVVIRSRHKGKYEVVAGQRRWQAMDMLGKETIAAVLLDSRADQSLASLAENVVREPLSTADLIDGVTAAYNRYGSIQATVEATGLPIKVVRAYVRYPRLPEPVRELVDVGEVDVKVALRALDALPEDADPADVADLAREMSGTTRANAEALARKATEEGPEEAIVAAREGPLLRTVTAPLPIPVFEALGAYCHQHRLTLEGGVLDLLSETLVMRGLLAVKDRPLVHPSSRPPRQRSLTPRARRST